MEDFKHISHYASYDINKDGIVDVTDAMTIVKHIAEAKDEAQRNPLCPEYYGAKGDGLPLYDWPVRCFGGFVDVPEESIKSVNVNVFAPSERIIPWFDNMPELITADSVFFNRSTNHFVLLHNVSYYCQWGSHGSQSPMPKMDMDGLNEENIWDDCSGGVGDYMQASMQPLENVVFSDLSTRISYVWRDGGMQDINSLMTDDYTAIMACLAANNGSMVLRDKACYYMLIRKQQADNMTNPLFGIKDFFIKGNGATIFARRVDGGNVPEDKGGVRNMDVFRFSNARNGKVEDLRIMALRDRDNGAPSGHKRFSSSDSALNAFSIISKKEKGRFCCNINFRNIACHGMYQDIDIRGGSDFNIRGWKSRNVCQNFVVAKNVVISRADIEQAPFVGTGMHLFYFGANNVWTFDSRFRQSSPFTTVMMTHHASEQADNIHYVNCLFEGNKTAQGNFFQSQFFNNCIFRQIWRGILTDERWGTCSSMIVGTKVNWYFNNCQFFIDREKLISTSKQDELELELSHCGLYGRNVGDVTMVTGFTGHLVAQGNIVNWNGPLGIDMHLVDK